MGKLSKKQQAIRAKIKFDQTYKCLDAIALLQEFTSKKFCETVDISINLGVDPRKSEQVVRSATILPKGTGKVIRVAVFAQGDNATTAKKVGADLVGYEDLMEQIKAGEINFDLLIATPDAMRLVGQLGQILGPKGLMPNPKLGTVTTNIEAAVRNAKAGQIRYRTDKNGIIHSLIGKINFSASDLIENIQALLNDLKKAKPPTAKGVYFKKISLSTTMGPGIAIDFASILV